MKILLFAAALSIGGVAAAQSTTDDSMSSTQSAQPSGQTVDDPSQATGPEGVTQQGTDPNGMGMAPPGTNMPVPQGAGPVVPAANQEAAFAPRPATQDYPACSKTVTDNCVQTYERGVRRPRR